MEANGHYRIAFALAILLVGIASGLIWYIFSINPFTTYQIQTADAVSGLVVDAPVEFHGVNVGKVKKIELINPHFVRILLSIQKDAPITQGTVATIISRGLTSLGFTGYIYISLEELNTDPRPILTEHDQPYPLIPTRPSQFSTLDHTMNRLSKNAEHIVMLLESLLDKQTTLTLKELISYMQQITRTLANNNDKLDTLLINTSSASNQLKPLLDSSSHNLRMLETQLLPKAYNSLSDLNSVLDQLTRMLDQIKQNPAVLIRGTTPPTPGPGETVRR